MTANKRVLVIGAGGHAKVVADIIRLQGYHLLGYLDDNPEKWDTTIHDYRILGNVQSFSSYTVDGLILGIGSNIIRKQIVERFGIEADPFWINAIHPQAIISPFAHLGRGIVIGAGAIINVDSVIGDQVIINTGSTIDHDCILESYVHIAPGTHLAGEVAVRIGAFVGIGSSVIPQKTIGKWSTVGAGSTVISDIPDQVVAKGSPARW